MILVCNNIPKFKNGIQEEVVQRVVLFEFLNRFRGTSRANPDLEKEILADDDEMEWLIYNGIEAYRYMIQSNADKIDFKARVDEEITRNLLGKHTDPITYILPKLVQRIYGGGEDAIKTWELNKLILFLAKKEGLSINKLDNQGRIQATHLANTIRHYFDFENNWTTKLIPGEDGEKVRIYPNLCKTDDYDEIFTKMKEEDGNGEDEDERGVTE